MDAALQINPYYGKTSRAGLLSHFNAVLPYGPTIVYNVPARTSQDITPELMLELAAHENFAGVKECEGNERIKGYTEKGVTCWTGNDDEAHDARFDAGAVGVISVTSNIVPGLMSEMICGDKPNPELRDRLLPLMNWLFAEPNPIGLNTMLAMLDCAEPVFWRSVSALVAHVAGMAASFFRRSGLHVVFDFGSGLRVTGKNPWVTVFETQLHEIGLLLL